ncbi:MAG: hypothetical protein HDS12_04540 [Bacteroides sp.]|nr:hypothetical protein [Bacteroidales bacterium]MBD5305540.1 hypothetical protein [Bacteroides sp.]MBD5347960.1 hypothetical protein [Bacteroides sp.]
MSLYDDNEKNDFFEDASDAPEVEKKKEPKKPALQPDDPRYWEEPEDEFEHLKPSHKTQWKLWLWVAVTAVVLGVIWGVYSRIFNPYIEDANQYGYVEGVEKRGEVFKTFEGVLLPYKNLMDSVRVYEGDIVFSTPDPALAARLKEMQFANRPVRITYKQYKTAMPWRGDSKIIITAVDSVNEMNILPPDRRPEYLKK